MEVTGGTGEMHATRGVPYREKLCGTVRGVYIRTVHGLFLPAVSLHLVEDTMPRPSLLLLPLLLAACSMGPATEPAPAPAPAPASSNVAPAPAAFPVGTYTTTIVDGDFPPGAPADMRSGVSGPWEISFGNGHVLATYGGRQVADVPYTVNGDELHFSPDSGEYACNTGGRYRWHATATELHLTKIEDSCDGRAVVLTSHALVRKP
jgi:hypothetical protein